jgi:RHS repeat-associated protein
MRKAYHQEVCGGRGLGNRLTACNYSYIQLIDFNARFYSPILGRFIQPDTVIPNPANPQSLNRFSYAYNNPVNYIDPSGHVPWGENEDDICLPGSDCYPDAEPWGGGESSGKYWDLLLDIEFPTILDNEGNLVEPGTFQSQFYIDTQSCGVVSISAILATFCKDGGQCLTANELYSLVQALIPGVGYGLSEQDLAKIIDELTPYSTTIYWNYAQKGANIVNVPNFGDDTAGVGLNLLANLLGNEEYPIAGVGVDGTYGNLSSSNPTYHWVIVVGLSPKMDEVLIYNPFNNILENYSTEEFIAHWKYPNPKSYLREIIAVKIKEE